MRQSALRYTTVPRTTPLSPSVRLPIAPDKAGDRLARIGWGSPKHCEERLRTTAGFVADALRLLHDHPSQRESLRRQLLCATNEEPEIPLSDELLRRLIHVDADGTASLGAALIDGITPPEARSVLPRLRMKAAVLADAIRALEGLA